MMILVDTGIWVDHLRSSDDRLAGLLERGQVLVHPFVTGELACGNLRNRLEVLRLLHALPQSRQASEKEALYFIEHHELMGSGIGYVDAYLLASVMLMDAARLWTHDKRLQMVARKLGCQY